MRTTAKPQAVPSAPASSGATDGAPIVVEGVTKRYPRRGVLPWGGPSGGTPALRDVSFAVREGETVGLLGPNGAGKTTMLKIIATLISPSKGRVLIAGHDAASHTLKARRWIGLVTCDERSFYWRLTGRHNLMFFATLYGIPPKRAEERVRTLLDVLDLTDAADRPFHGYSSGMRQKLAIARGLLGDPAIILYDEPTRSLDPLSAQNIRRWVVANRAHYPRTAHLIATNQLREAEQLCDRVLIINRGALVAHGTVEEIRQMWERRAYAVHRIVCRNFESHGILGSAPEHGLIDVAEESSEAGLITLRLRADADSEALSRTLQSILDAGGSIVRCETERASFDDVFCALLEDERAKGAAPAPGATP